MNAEVTEVAPVTNTENSKKHSHEGMVRCKFCGGTGRWAPHFRGKGLETSLAGQGRRGKICCKHCEGKGCEKCHNTGVFTLRCNRCEFGWIPAEALKAKAEKREQQSEQQS